MDLSLLQAFNAERNRRKAAILVTDLSDASQRLVRVQSDLTTDVLGEHLAGRFRSGKSGMVSHNGHDYFLNVSLPATRLVIIGAVHISQALAHMAVITGLDVTIIDPRSAFATKERFPAHKLVSDWPESALNEVELDPYTAVATVTHDPKIDDFPLIAALNSNCFYVGALGSRKTHEKRVDRLLSAGLSRSQIDRIDAPIGLDIGAMSPSEIAVAILAAVISSLRKGVEVSE